jgi:hypothetical protein
MCPLRRVVLLGWMAVSGGSLMAASLGGLVQDPTAWPVAGARITLTSQSSPIEAFTTVTDASGRFNFEALIAGTYDVLVEAPGFQRRRQSGVQIGNNEDVQLPALVLNVSVGCWDRKPPSRLQRILYRIRTFFVPIDWSKAQTCM